MSSLFGDRVRAAKQANPDFGYIRIAAIVGCSKDVVRHYLNPQYRENKKQRDVDNARRKKRYLIEMLGGECVKCAYSRCIAALDFHHLDPASKSFEIGDCLGKTLDSLIIEAQKCELVCANCHRETHDNFLVSKL